MVMPLTFAQIVDHGVIFAVIISNVLRSTAAAATVDATTTATTIIIATAATKCHVRRCTANVC
jgi:hypothetical protein